MMTEYKEKLKNLPQAPGVYEFKNKNGEVIYVGKAKNLKNRVSQYFSGHDERDQIPYLMEEATDLDYTVVTNELESLFLESTLIKKYLPKYNIMLRDDKNYAFIKIDYSTEIPQIVIVRKVSDTNSQLPITNFQINPKSKIQNLKSRYFGPYTAAYKIRNTLNMIRRIFPYCSAQKVSSRPCFYYYLHRCPGVCIGKISLEEYSQQLEKICEFLSGNTKKIQAEIKQEMQKAAKRKQFELAAKLRDQFQALKLVEERQIVILPKAVSWDIVSMSSDQGYACVNLFKVRNGKLFDKENFVYELPDSDLRMPSDTVIRRVVPSNDWDGSADNYGSEILQRFLEQYYLETSSVSKEIYIQNKIEDEKAIQELIFNRFSKKVKIKYPQKGKPKELVNLGVTNAGEYLKQWLQSQAGHLDKINTALTRLKEILDLPNIPERIEGFDISNIQGTNAVGSMVVFEKGLPKKSEYRKFRIKTKQTPDDFAMMKEMLARRLARSVIARSVSDEAISPNIQIASSTDKALSPRNDKTKAWPIPDLIVIDGGKGQLSAALEVLQTTNYKLPTIPIIGLAKKLEEIFVPEKPEPIILSQDDPALQLLQRLRDEAHRFGITYHRNLRSKQAVKSALDNIPGIGPKTKKLLKDKFGTVAQIRKTSYDDLAEVVGERIAQLIQQTL